MKSYNCYTSREYGRGNKKVLFLLGGWKTKQWLYWLPAQVLVRSGYYCIVYTFDKEVFSPNVPKTTDSLHQIRQAVLDKISALKKRGHTDFSIFGFSLGALLACLTANSSPDITKVILNLTGISPADATWTWNKNYMATFKQRLVEQGYTLLALQTAWHSIASQYNIGNFQGKRTLIYLAKHDQIIPFPQGEQLIEHMKAAKYQYRCITNKRGGHMTAGLYNLFNFKVYMLF